MVVEHGVDLAQVVGAVPEEVLGGALAAHLDHEAALGLRAPLVDDAPEGSVATPGLKLGCRCRCLRRLLADNSGLDAGKEVVHELMSEIVGRVGTGGGGQRSGPSGHALSSWKWQLVQLAHHHHHVDVLMMILSSQAVSCQPNMDILFKTWWSSQQVLLDPQHNHDLEDEEHSRVRHGLTSFHPLPLWLVCFHLMLLGRRTYAKCKMDFEQTEVAATSLFETG